jgi:MoaA/NifB/PqqE/SkfB family radical SAM enzyme
VELGRRRGFKVTVFTTVTHESLYTEGFDRIKDFCLDRGVVLWILIGIPVGNWAGQTDVLIDEKDHAYLEGLCRASNNLIRRDLSTRYFTAGCPSVSESFYLDPYGELLPCPFIHASLGNVRQHRVRDILDRALTLEKFRTNSPVCLIGEDREFIASYGRRTFAAEQIPITEDVFGFPESLPPRPGPLGGEPPAG